MPHKCSIFILLLLAGLQCIARHHAETIWLEHDGYQRSYVLFVPEDFTHDKSYPVLLILHGGGGTARGLIRNTRSEFNKLASQNDFIAVYPNGIGKSWNDGARDTLAKARKLNINDVGFIERILDDLNSKINVDREHIFACGISNGGFMVQRLAYEIPEKIKGIAVVASSLKQSSTGPANSKNSGTRNFHKRNARSSGTFQRWFCFSIQSETR